MAKMTGLGHRLFVGGVDISGDTTAVDEITGSLEVLECTGIDKSAYERIGGLRDGTIKATTWFNPTVGATHDTIAALPTSDVIASYLTGTTVGDAAVSMVAKQLGYHVSRGDDGSLTGDFEATANGYGLAWGQLLTAGIKTDTTGSNGTALDYGATIGSTTFGLQAYLHVFAVTGTSVTIKIQDSADNSTFADVSGAAFTAATTAGAQRIAVTGTVRRYVRVVSSGTFTNAQYCVNVIKNLTSVVF